jgi:hypothetical protein
MSNTKICVVCGIEFVFKSSKAKYCSKNCNHNAYKKANPEKVRKRIIDWRNNNKEHCSDYRKSRQHKDVVYWRERRKNDPIFRIKGHMRARINSVMKGGKSRSLTESIGCNDIELRQYIESKFQEGMTWENYGKNGWQIDHIKPLALFDLLDPEQFKQANHFSNLQPLWEADNLRKWCKYA